MRSISSEIVLFFYFSSVLKFSSHTVMIDGWDHLSVFVFAVSASVLVVVFVCTNVTTAEEKQQTKQI